MSAVREIHEGPLRVAVMSFAHTHARSYLALLAGMDDVEVRASDPGPHPEGELRGRAMADALGVAYADTYDELLAWRPDAVIVASENVRHRELVELAASAGADILCEKPLATTLEDGLAMERAVADAGVRLMVAFPVRFASAFQELRAAHARGALGQLVALRGANNGKLPMERAWFGDPALSGGGALVDHVVHVADLLDALTGAEAVSVTAVSNRILHAHRAQAETGGLVTITYDSGLVAAIDCSFTQADTAPTWGGVKVTATGTAGSVGIDFFGPRVRGLDAATGRPIELPYGPDFDAALLDAFLAGVRGGEQPQPDLQVGLRTLRIVLAAQESARTGRTIEVAAL
ncbi:Gfo/Idh/MocA family protein [Clavibacter phaseoli]|nr:Gfo/Idh/MocA family oxidoreductase [Clavibacter phaseoli]